MGRRPHGTSATRLQCSPSRQGHNRPSRGQFHTKSPAQATTCLSRRLQGRSTTWQRWARAAPRMPRSRICPTNGIAVPLSDVRRASLQRLLMLTPLVCALSQVRHPSKQSLRPKLRSFNEQEEEQAESHRPPEAQNRQGTLLGRDSSKRDTPWDASRPKSSAKRAYEPLGRGGGRPGSGKTAGKADEGPTTSAQFEPLGRGGGGEGGIGWARSGGGSAVLSPEQVRRVPPRLALSSSEVALLLPPSLDAAATDPSTVCVENVGRVSSRRRACSDSAERR